MNIRPKPLEFDHNNWVKKMSKISAPLDPNIPEEAEQLKQSLGNPDNWDNIHDEVDSLSVEEQKQQLWDMFEARPEENKYYHENFAAWNWGLDDVYQPTYFTFFDRGNGIQNDKRTQQAFLELEYILEDVMLQDRKKTQQVEMYKGQVKKWQILDDDAFDRDQIEKIQSAVKAPSPAELEEYQEKSKTPLNLPITNQNVYKWRDEPLASDSADFNPE